jgi:hypothetical protein
MRRRKPTAIRQINLRINEKLRRQLETAAKERQISINQLIRSRLESDLDEKDTEDLIGAAAMTARRAAEIERAITEFAHTSRNFYDMVFEVLKLLAVTKDVPRAQELLKTMLAQREQKEGAST